MGSITVSPHAKIGQYILRITVASSNAGAFELLNSSGSVIGTGNVASAYVGNGLAFTLADGSNDFIVGDTFTITVTGTEKYKILENTASDGSAALLVSTSALRLVWVLTLPCLPPLTPLC